MEPVHLKGACTPPVVGRREGHTGESEGGGRARRAKGGRKDDVEPWETPDRQRRAGREPTSQNVGSGRGAKAPRTLRTRDSPEGGRGSAAGLKAKRRAHQWQSHDARRNSGAVAKALRQLVRPLTGGAPAERPASWAPCREHGTAG